MAETAPIAKMAEKISEELFKWFKWEKIDLMDQNFVCHKPEKHSKDKENHTHPVDVVFHYIDPYLNKRILFNTDLKSYKKGSITTTSVRNALKSLALTLDCARSSKEWKRKYNTFDDSIDIRGMLFVYNHDGEYDKNFYKMFNKVKNERIIRIENLPIQKNQQIHIVEPSLINYMTTITTDMSIMHKEGTFPDQNYYFYYPDLHLHKTHGMKEKRPASLEMLSAPFIIIEHSKVEKYNEKTRNVEDLYPEGYVIYYNKNGGTHYEFIYLLDTLSKFQILKHGVKLRIRLTHPDRDSSIFSNFQKATNAYSQAWDFDKCKQEVLEEIEFQPIEIKQKCFSTEEIGWRV